MVFKPTQRLCARTEARIKGFRSPAIKILRGAIVGMNERELPGVLKQDLSARRSQPSTALTKPSKTTVGSGTASIPKSELLALQSESSSISSAACFCAGRISNRGLADTFLRIKVRMGFVETLKAE
jgi:hypothetical protein